MDLIHINACQLKKMQFFQEFLSCFIFSTSQVGPAPKELCLHRDRDIQLHAHNPKEGSNSPKLNPEARASWWFNIVFFL
ncbi:hypothetical protein ACOSQ3_001487 [Xanthoceras sorbifolium]